MSKYLHILGSASSAFLVVPAAAQLSDAPAGHLVASLYAHSDGGFAIDAGSATGGAAGRFGAGVRAALPGPFFVGVSGGVGANEENAEYGERATNGRVTLGVGAGRRVRVEAFATHDVERIYSVRPAFRDLRSSSLWYDRRVGLTGYARLVRVGPVRVGAALGMSVGHSVNRHSYTPPNSPRRMDRNEFRVAGAVAALPLSVAVGSRTRVVVEPRQEMNFIAIRFGTGSYDSLKSGLWQVVAVRLDVALR